MKKQSLKVLVSGATLSALALAGGVTLSVDNAVNADNGTMMASCGGCGAGCGGGCGGCRR